jgi:methylmalonyl-CoA mutase N-terminal domain/subunit
MRHDGPDGIGEPGAFPFTRGIFAEGYRRIPWMEAFASGFGLPETTNQHEKDLRAKGHRGYNGRSSINLVFDRPTFEGFDSDHPLARHEVGEVGVAVDSIADVERLFEGFDLASLNVGLILDRSGPPVFAMYLAHARRIGVPWPALRGIVTNNPLEAYFISRMRLFPPEATLRMTADTMRFVVRDVPNFNACRVNGYSLRESGATAVQEVAFALAKAIAIVEECDRRGVSPADTASHTSFQFAQDSQFFDEIAKIRAGRRIWARTLRSQFGVAADSPCRMKIHMQTSGASLTAQSPLNNAVRVALQTLSAAMAGPQSVHICAYDEALGIPTPQALELAVMTSKIVMAETGVADYTDPLGGSYVIEALTDQYDDAITAELERIAEMGGAVAAIRSRYFEQEIVDSASRQQAAVDAGTSIKVGVNAYESESTEKLRVFRVNPSERQTAIRRCRELKRSRNQAGVDRAVGELSSAAADDEADIMPRLISAAEADVTVGEMCGALSEVFGSWSEPAVLAALA